MAASIGRFQGTVVKVYNQTKVVKDEVSGAETVQEFLWQGKPVPMFDLYEIFGGAVMSIQGNSVRLKEDVTVWVAIDLQKGKSAEGFAYAFQKFKRVPDPTIAAAPVSAAKTDVKK